MTQHMTRKLKSERLNPTSPIIHLPESEHIRCNKKRSQVVMVTSSSKVKTSSGTFSNSSPTSDTVVLNPGNFNLCRPGRSTEVLNGLQCMYTEKQKKEAAQRKESAKLFLDFIRKRQKTFTEEEAVDNKTDRDENVIKIEQEVKDIKDSNSEMKVARPQTSDRFSAPVRNSIELTRRSLRNSARRGWVSDVAPLVSLHLIHPGSDGSDQPAIHLPESGACKGYQVTNMTTALPRITPCSTPLPPNLAPVRSHSAASLYTYGAYPPPELSSSVDFVHIPKRNNPLVPLPPRKRINWTWETTDQHYENEKRRLLMQKREHTRYHSAWSKAFYGSPAEAEAYRRHFREQLKMQMSDKDHNKRTEQQEKVRESDRAIAYDRECRMNDANEYYRKHNYLMQFRDGNKSLMENTWEAKKYNREVENRIDRERLRYNPINWSCSLK